MQYSLLVPALLAITPLLTLTAPAPENANKRTLSLEEIADQGIQTITRRGFPNAQIWNITVRFPEPMRLTSPINEADINLELVTPQPRGIDLKTQYRRGPSGWRWENATIGPTGGEENPHMFDLDEIGMSMSDAQAAVENWPGLDVNRREFNKVEIGKWSSMPGITNEIFFAFSNTDGWWLEYEIFLLPSTGQIWYSEMEVARLSSATS